MTGALVLVSFVVFSIQFGKRGNDQIKDAESTGIHRIETSRIRSMLDKYPYIAGSYSGARQVLDSKTEIWMIGRRIKANIASDGYIGLENKYGNTYPAKSNSIKYTAQKGDDLEGANFHVVSPGSILIGDFIALRMTFINNYGLVLEMRELLRD